MSENQRLSFEYIQNIFEENGYIIIDEEYFGIDSKMSFYDTNGYYYFSSYKNLKSLISDNLRFRKFDKSNIYTIKNMQHLIELENRSYYLISDKYISNRDKLRFHCTVCDQKWDATWGNMVKGDHGCPYCSGNKTYFGNSLGDNFEILTLEWMIDKNNISPF